MLSPPFFSLQSRRNRFRRQCLIFPATLQLRSRHLYILCRPSPMCCGALPCLGRPNHVTAPEATCHLMTSCIRTAVESLLLHSRYSLRRFRREPSTRPVNLFRAVQLCQSQLLRVVLFRRAPMVSRALLLFSLLRLRQVFLFRPVLQANTLHRSTCNLHPVGPPVGRRQM